MPRKMRCTATAVAAAALSAAAFVSTPSAAFLSAPVAYNNAARAAPITSGRYTTQVAAADAIGLSLRRACAPTRGYPRRRTSLAVASSEVGEAAAAPAATPGAQTTLAPGASPSTEWEVDVYSRPVVNAEGKKLWELLICDSTGGFRHVEPIASNMVNSREVRRAVERVMEAAPVRPRSIRFFRNAMFNMISIALGEIDVAVAACRTTYALYQWLEERERAVYPAMEGYRPQMQQPPAFLDIRTPQRMPDALRGEKYAFVSLPLSEFRAGGSISAENIGVGRLCPVSPELPADAMVPGLAIFTQRAVPLAQWAAGLELAFVRADLKRREMVLECGINTQYLLARVGDDQRAEAQAFETAKAELRGLHFVTVQESGDADDVAACWLLKEVRQ